jgi:hypothetical protein
MDAKKKKAQDAASILNYLLGDLVGASRSYSIFEQLADRANAKKIRLVMRRMFVSYIILTLAKISEFYDKYHDVIPEECRRPCKDLKTKIEKLGIRDFRNVFVGHIHDKSDRPISDDQSDDHYQKITNGDVIKFLEWINTPDTNTFSTTVVGIVESTRDKILQQYGVSL